MPRLAPKPPEKPVSVPVRVIRYCDRCGHQAAYMVDVVAGSLYFCGHHFTDHSGHIFAEGYRVTKVG